MTDQLPIISPFYNCPDCKRVDFDRVPDGYKCRHCGKVYAAEDFSTDMMMPTRKVTGTLKPLDSMRKGRTDSGTKEDRRPDETG